jgi:hypothetical protein
MEGSEVKVIPNAEGNRLTPSVVAFNDKSETIVGEPARRQAVTNPRRTVYSVKRFMGRRHSEVESEEKIVPYQVVGGANEYVKVQIGDQQFTPQEISAKVLRKLKEAALAGKLKAKRMLLLTDVPGVRGADGKIIRQMTVGQASQLIEGARKTVEADALTDQKHRPRRFPQILSHSNNVSRGKLGHIVGIRAKARFHE